MCFARCTFSAPNAPRHIDQTLPIMRPFGSNMEEDGIETFGARHYAVFLCLGTSPIGVKETKDLERTRRILHWENAKSISSTSKRATKIFELLIWERDLDENFRSTPNVVKAQTGPASRPITITLCGELSRLQQEDIHSALCRKRWGGRTRCRGAGRPTSSSSLWRL